MEGLYLIHTREFIRSKEPIYKIGRGDNVKKRVFQYPNGSDILFVNICKQSKLCEAQLIEIFKEKFKQETFYGREYFSGNMFEMIKIMTRYIEKHNDKYIEEDKANEKKKEKQKEEEEEEEKKAKQKQKEEEDKAKQKQKEEDKARSEIKEEVKTKPKVKSTIGNIKDRTCPKCNRVFKFPTMLKQHFKKSFHCLMNDAEIILYFNPNIIKCNKCSETFKQKSSLYRHQRTINCI